MILLLFKEVNLYHLLFIQIYGKDYLCSYYDGNKTSKVNLNASSNILGIYIFNKGLDSSIHGFVLTSINHTS